ncbi:MAG TPA: exodeoxyribonuclease III [Myxococcaceae bacterium]|nr:exodeoxyribonuclease III [Myxococcaceae bacterium]
MLIATWNINSVRARVPRLEAWLASRRPDVLCLQELKCTEEQFPVEAVRKLGYHAIVYGQKSYNGVAVLSLAPPEDVERGLPVADDDGEARVVAATVRGIRILSLYAPNGQAVDSPAYRAKLAWYARLRRVLDARYRADQPLVLCGDFNVAPEERDVWDPALWEGQTLFSLPEREALKELVGFGLSDCFRRHHPEPGRYSWWDYRMLGFPKNHGLRIDHVLATAPLAERCEAADIDREARKGPQPSDHAPVWARFRLGSSAEERAVAGTDLPPGAPAV